MRFVLFFIALVLVASLSQADTSRYGVEDFLHVQFDSNEAALAYHSLDLPEEQLSEGKGKNFRTRDGSVDLTCFKRHYNANEPYACHFVFDFRGLSKEVTLKPDTKGMRFQINNKQTSAELYEALLVQEAVYKSKRIKTLELDNARVVIKCGLDTLRPNSTPDCSVLTAVE